MSSPVLLGFSMLSLILDNCRRYSKILIHSGILSKLLLDISIYIYTKKAAA